MATIEKRPYKKKTYRGRASYIDSYDSQGNPIYKRKDFTRPTAKEAKKAAEDFERIKAMGVDINKRNMLVADWLQEWWDSTCSRREREGKPYSSNTILSYTYPLKYLKETYGDLTLGKAENLPEKAEAALWYKTESVGTARTRRAVLNMALQEALFKKYISHNPLTRVKPFNTARRSAESIRTFEPHEIKQLFKLAEGTTIEHAVRIHLALGCRAGELLALRWTDIDWKDNVVHIRHSVNHITKQLSDTKNHKIRRVDVSPETLRQFQLQRESIPVQFIDDFVFPTNMGRMPMVTVYTFKLKVIYKKMGLKSEKNAKLQPTHIFRHTRAKMLLDEGHSMAKVAQYLGHTDYATTANYYKHFSIDSLKDMATSVDKYLAV